MSRSLTRQQVLSWRDTWSRTDKAMVEAAVGALPATTAFYETTSYAAARVDGRVAVYISPGYLSWSGGQWSAELDPALFGALDVEDGWAWKPLSTFRPHQGSKPSIEEFDEPWAGCFTVPARNGTCSCD
ncbi:hypothetical protein KLP28_13480 [Nocardioidaceae bacterium]|nr:hypothetical protein KLP28_13480 [Nocardioidaceae bacterium]